MYELELWEFINYLDGRAEEAALNIKLHDRHAVLVGAYCGHYVNGGRKARDPNAVIERIMRGEEPLEEITDEDAAEIFNRTRQVIK